MKKIKIKKNKLLIHQLVKQKNRKIFYFILFYLDDHSDDDVQEIKPAPVVEHRSRFDDDDEQDKDQDNGDEDNDSDRRHYRHRHHHKRSRRHSSSTPASSSSKSAMTPPIINNNNNQLEIELIDDKPKLPSYFPAIQGCRKVDEYQCLNRIEEGTYGVVFRAKDKKTG
jgi:cell division cycle 2-like protein